MEILFTFFSGLGKRTARCLVKKATVIQIGCCMQSKQQRFLFFQLPGAIDTTAFRTTAVHSTTIIVQLFSFK